MADDTLEARLVELESRHMHQERLLEALDRVVLEQRRELEQLRREVVRLREQLETGAEERGGHDEKPPHH